MVINRLLAERNMTKYRLSKLSGVAQTTINDICSGKADLEKCSAGTLYRIAKALDSSVEEILLDREVDYRISFETFKGNVCHRVKDQGDLTFIVETIRSDSIRDYYNKKWFPEALYLLAMLDYISRENGIEQCHNYDDLRQLKLEKPIYPEGVFLYSEVIGSEQPLREAEEDSIPEFSRFNIIESEVRKVV